MKALENDTTVVVHLEKEIPNISSKLENSKKSFEVKYIKNITTFLATFPYDSAEI
ncbi:hypothetical protein ACNO6Z_13225, partial [Aliarcobacter lanthieri]|uniref:hypothetical protein n=1 Tax=Aliarcobacter lanthieri TaxID=1355374 RepID=UPI003AA9927E